MQQGEAQQNNRSRAGSKRSTTPDNYREKRQARPRRNHDPDAGEEQSTRARILKLLRVSGAMKASALASELELTEMAVRRHMYELVNEGSAKIVAVKQAMGRPLHMYELTDQADDYFPKNYQVLALDLLDELDQDPETARLVSKMFEGRKQKLLERYEPYMRKKTLGQRVHELTKIQNSGGYMAEMQELADGSFVINEYNCPIAQVADKYQQACHCELALFADLLQVPVERVECLSKGGGKCSYHIG